MTYWQMYLITRLDVVLLFAAISSVLSAGLFVLVLAAVGEKKKELKYQLKEAKKGDWTLPDVPDIERELKEIEDAANKGGIFLLSLFLLSLSFLLFLPSEKSMYKIIIVPKIVNNETIRSDYRELYDLAVDALKETLKGRGKR